MRKELALGFILIVAGCASSVSSDIAASKASLAAMEQTAKAYVELPLCGTVESVGKPFCSSKSVISIIKDADNAAYEAVQAADKSQDATNMQRAQIALQALQNALTEIWK